MRASVARRTTAALLGLNRAAYAEPFRARLREDYSLGRRCLAAILNVPLPARAVQSATEQVASTTPSHLGTDSGPSEEVPPIPPKGRTGETRSGREHHPKAGSRAETRSFFSAPHLLTEDRPEFERVLDEALRIAADPPGASASTLNSEQLRTMALSAEAAISACAGAEYDHYLQVRRRQRAAHNTTTYAMATGGAGVASGAGLFAIVAVLTPILAGTAALIFLVVGYLLAAMTPEPAIASPLRTVGWLFAAIAATGILVGMVGLVVTALRDGSSAIRASNSDTAELATAKEAWLAALRDRGMLPFLTEAQASSAAHSAADRAPIRIDAPDTPRTPRLGYSRPGVSSPDLTASEVGEENERH